MELEHHSRRELQPGYTDTYSEMLKKRTLHWIIDHLSYKEDNCAGCCHCYGPPEMMSSQGVSYRNRNICPGKMKWCHLKVHLTEGKKYSSRYRCSPVWYVKHTIDEKAEKEPDISQWAARLLFAIIKNLWEWTSQQKRQHSQTWKSG